MEKSADIKLVDLLKADPKDLEPLQSGLQATQGKLQVLVHPYFKVENSTDPFVANYDSLPQYQTLRDKHIRETMENGHPLLVFEAHPQIEYLSERISYPGTVYYIETHVNTPQPVGKSRRDERGGYVVREDLDWQEIGAKLKSSGATVAQVGGLRLYFDSINSRFSQYASIYDPQNKTLPVHQFRPSVQKYADAIRLQIGESTHLAVDDFLQNEELVAQGCVGGVWLGLLQQGIDVDFSPIRAAEYSNSVPESAKKY